HINPSKAAYIKNAHNEYLEALVEGGLIGGLLFISIYGFFIYQLIQKMRKEKTPDLVLGILLTSIILIHSFLDSILHFTPQLVLLYFLIGLFDNTKSFKLNLKSVIGNIICISIIIYSSTVLYKQA